jgi:hypothetical protein
LIYLIDNYAQDKSREHAICREGWMAFGYEDLLAMPIEVSATPLFS